MDSFYAKVSSRIEDLILAIVALGILVVSIEYVQLYLDHPDSINWVIFAEKMVLFLAVILFTAYYFLAYSAFFQRQSTHKRLRELRAGRIVALYMIDLAQVAIAALPYTVLLVGTLTSAPDEYSSDSVLKADHLGVTINHLQFLFWVMLLWHIIVGSWYAVFARSRWSFGLHGVYVLVYIALLVILPFIQDNMESSLIKWCLILGYLFIVISLYVTKGRRDINKLIEQQEAPA